MPSILVVDDDLPVAQLIQVILDSAGFDVDVAGDGQEALEKVAHSRPSLLVLDLTLPAIGGPELAAQIRELCGEPIPILVLSGDERTPIKAEQLGAVGHLSKPFGIDDLLYAVATALQPAEIPPSVGSLPAQAQ